MTMEFSSNDLFLKGAAKNHVIEGKSAGNQHFLFLLFLEPVCPKSTMIVMYMTLLDNKILAMTKLKYFEDKCHSNVVIFL